MTEPSSFIVYKGTLMTMAQIERWKKAIGGQVRIPCVTSFTENFRQAVYSCANYDQTLKGWYPVIFSFAILNQTSYPGFRLNTEKFAAYPDEEEILIPSGINVELEGHDTLRATRYLPYPD